MKFLNNIKAFIATRDKNEFYYYLIGFLAGLLIVSASIMYYQLSSVDYWRKRINDINELREEIRKVIDKDQHVLSQRAEVNKMLAETPDFKIDGYFTDLLTKLNLTTHKTLSSVTYADRGDPEYREVLLNAKFDTMNMKQLCELLDAIEQTKRVYTKELEIVKSKKIPNTIDVNVTIATLQAKPEITEVAE